MAYHYEQNSSGQVELIIDGWEQGIGDDPFNGHEMILNMNIRNIPGVAYENLLQVASVRTGLARVNYIVQDPLKLSNLYAVDQSGNVWQSLNFGKTWSQIPNSPTGSDNGNGICIWPIGNYYGAVTYSWLIVFRDAAVDFMKINASGYDNTYSWQSITPFTTSQVSGANHYCIASRAKQNNSIPVLYFCNGSYLGSMFEVTSKTFDPTDPTTYDFNDTLLALPKSSEGIATGIVELKDNLYVTIGKLIVPWDYYSTEYNTPFEFSENVNKPIVIGSTIYLFGGAYLASDGKYWYPGSGKTYVPQISGRGYIYQYNGWDGGLYKKIPDHIIDLPFGLDPQWIIGGTMAHLNKLFFGVKYGSLTSASNLLNRCNGVHSIDENGALSIENRDNDFPTALASLDNSVIANNTISYAEAVDLYSGGSIAQDFKYTSDTIARSPGQIYSQIIKVGTKIKPKTFNQYEVRLKNPLGEGESISVMIKKYYSGTSSSSNTYTAPANDTAVSFIFPCQVKANEYIQILLSTSGSTDKSGCPIKEIILR